LNWNNPAVEKAMFDTMRFWLDRGVAGFRLDAIPTLYEDPQLRDEPATGGVNAQGDPNLKHIYTDNLPQVHDVIRKMREMVNGYPGNRVLMGETYLPNTMELDKWYGGAAKNELQLAMDMLVGFNDGYSAEHFRKFIGEAETELQGSQPLFVFDNHDNRRSITRYGDGVHDVAVAKTVAAMLLTTRATALTYYGAEIGMPTTTPTRREDVKDPIGITGWPKEKGRDGERTPMQWTPALDAGFSTAKTTWLPIPPSYKTINVQTESANPDSLLNWYKQLIELRRTNATLHDGAFAMLDAGDANVLAYVRTPPKGSNPVVMAINMSAQAKTVSLDVSKFAAGKRVKTLAASEASLRGVTSVESVTLPAYSAWVAEVE
jgi:alpha-glucosidase